jgi:hypothetical protein
MVFTEQSVLKCYKLDQLPVVGKPSAWGYILCSLGEINTGGKAAGA